jgi:hypothetical protein
MNLNNTVHDCHTFVGDQANCEKAVKKLKKSYFFCFLEEGITATGSARILMISWLVLIKVSVYHPHDIRFPRNSVRRVRHCSTVDLVNRKVSMKVLLKW